jgi:putative ABC transport system ATP-binding protein
MGAPAPIQLAGVSYFYGREPMRRQVLYAVDAEIHEGEIVILTGPSGSGKTTLITLIGALRAAQEGSVRIFGDELLRAPERRLVAARRRIGYVFQQHNLLDSLSVGQNVEMSLRLGDHRLRGAAARKRIEQVLDEVGLSDHIDKFPSQLSGGQKQRAGIARALVNQPRLILADEPTASLDKESGRNVVSLLQRLSRQQGATVVMVTHDNRILDVADRLLHLEDGRMQSLSEAVALSTSRMLHLLERHDPGAARYLAALSGALARVAFADGEFDASERDTIRRVLGEAAALQPAEIDLVMELALTQVRVKQQTAQASDSVLTTAQREHFVSALRAVAAADGRTSEAELEEIQSIAREMGFPESAGDPSSGVATWPQDRPNHGIAIP